MLHEGHEKFDFDNDMSETYFHTPVFTIWQVRGYKERNNFILRTTFQKCLVLMLKCV